jgi:hypothetical protein
MPLIAILQRQVCGQNEREIELEQFATVNSEQDVLPSNFCDKAAWTDRLIKKSGVFELITSWQSW